MEEGAEGGEEGQTGTNDLLIDNPANDDRPSDDPPSDDPRSDDPPGDDPANDERPSDDPPGDDPRSEDDTTSGRLRAAAPYAIVALTALFMTRVFWLPGRFVVGFDNFAYSAPHLEVTEQAVRDLRVPQINDLIFGGVPQLGNPQVGVWYPAHLLTLLFETNRAMGLIVTIHVLMLGLGTVLLARRLGTGRVGATVAGVACVSSGAVLVKTVQFEQILAFAWAPLLLIAIHATLNADRPWRPMAATAITTAAVLAAGHPQLAFQTIILAFAATIGFVVGDERWRRLPYLAGGVLAGVLIAAPPLVAALAGTSDSAIGLGRTFDDLRSPALSVGDEQLLRAILGTPQEIDPAIFAGGPESVGAIGVAVAVLAVIGIVRSIARRESRPWAISLGVFAVLATFWSMGPRTPVFRVAYEVVPGFDLARGSARWLVMVALVAALFAGIGAQAIVDGARKSDIGAAAAAVGTVSLLVAVGVFDTFADRTALIWATTAAIVIALVAITVRASDARVAHVAALAIIGVLVLELGLIARTSFPQILRADTRFTAHHAVPTDWLIGKDGYTVAFTDDGRDADYLVPGLRPNTNALSSIPSIDGYDGGVQVTERWATALYRFTPEPLPTLPMRNSMPVPLSPDVMARFGVRFMLLDNKRPADLFLDNWIGPQASDENFGVFENPAWLGEAIAWRAAEPVASDRAAADLLRTEPDRYGATALVDDPAAALACELSAVRCAPVGLAVERRNPEHVVVRTSLDTPSVVMLTRQALPDWTVRVDGRDADEVTVDGLFLGVEVPAGEHEIEWRYRSPYLSLTIAVSVISLIATIALAACATVWPRPGRLRQRRHEPI